MANVFVVDDSPLDRQLAGRILEEIGLHVFSAADGQAAIDRLTEVLPDIVLTDLQMPRVDGLELVKYIHKQHPTIPVILMTAYGSEEIAVRALQAGAASYVPKQNLSRDLVGTVKNVLSIARARRESLLILDSMKRLEVEYVLGNAIDGLEALLGHVKDHLRQMRLFGDTDVLRVCTALYEAVLNAIEHGNLELRAEERDQEGPYYRRVVESRGSMAPFRNRHVYLTIRLTRSEARLTVRDEGKGFDPASLCDPTLAENVGEMNGRGLFLIRTFMDEVSYNDLANEITMVKRRTI